MTTPVPPLVPEGPRLCDHDPCVLDVLQPVFGDESGNIAMNYTCFPMSCEVASEQARKLVKRISEDGLTKAAALAEVQAEIDADFAEVLTRHAAEPQP